MRSRTIRSALLSMLVVAACHSSSVATPSWSSSPLAPAEAEFQAWHALGDRIFITNARGMEADTDGSSVAALRIRRSSSRAETQALLKRVDSATLEADDQRAYGAIRTALAGDPGLDAGGDPGASPPSCTYDAAAIARGDSAYERLRARMYGCYTKAVQSVRFEGRSLDRLTAIGMLAKMDDRERRHRLFLAIDTIWRSMNGDDSPGSQYRQYVRLSAARWRANGSPVDASARALGIDPAVMEQWLISVLDAWRAGTPSQMIEPWDWHYAAGAASRALDARIPFDSLTALNAHYFRDLGADVGALRVHFDLAARAGKTPVAFTEFGKRSRMANGAWMPAEPWVFASYRVGGLDNLDELLHETGHAVHIAQIRTRPAYLDWPENVALVEGLGDVAALEVYEPRWQQKYLGDSVPTAVGLRARYAGIVLDIAWSLFEVRMHRTPDADPNAVWDDITSTYLHITPHPELSWWAMRGQLIDEPGYMANYAIGSIIIADLRARVRELHGPFTTGDSTWYAFMTERIYRYGLERSAADVIHEMLGRPISTEAMLADMRRMRAGP